MKLTERDAMARARAHVLGDARLGTLREVLATIPHDVWWYMPEDDTACAEFVRGLIAGYFTANGVPAPDWAAPAEVAVQHNPS